MKKFLKWLISYEGVYKEKNGMKSLLKWLISALIFYSGALHLYLFILHKIRPKILVLCYHRIVQELNPSFPSGMETGVNTFKKQLEYLSKNYKVISYQTFIDYLKQKIPLPSCNLCLLTFDDGWKETYTHAFPLLKKYRLPAIIFLPTSCIGTEKKEFYPRFGIPEDFVGRPFLNWEEVYLMSSSGLISFGCHTQTHPLLDEISLEKAMDEISKPRLKIEEELHLPARTFAYPKGRWNEKLKEMVEKAGYECAFTTKEEFFDLKLSPYLIPRRIVHEGMSIEVSGRFSKSIFAAVINGMFK